MNDVYIGKGKLAGKGVYAARDFKAGELVKSYNLRPLTQAQFDTLPKSEQMFVHSFWGKMYLFPEPSRYTNHSADPNTRADLQNMCNYAIRSIKKGEMITTNATREVQAELETFLEVHEKTPVANFKWHKGGYRNAAVSYSLPDGSIKTLTLKRSKGNWRIIAEE
jgi:hypothetical protein